MSQPVTVRRVQLADVLREAGGERDGEADVHDGAVRQPPVARVHAHAFVPQRVRVLAAATRHPRARQPVDDARDAPVTPAQRAGQ